MQSCSGENERYKWVVLVAACFSQMLRAGFIAGTLSLFSIYYVERYSDRTLSSSIGAIQISTASICAFPSILLNKKIGERWSQIIGGLFTAGGMAATAFTTQAWQGILSNAAATGLGAAFLSAATYSVLSKYFPGSQLAPYAAITVCQNIGVLATPQLVGRAMMSLGFTRTFQICAAIMSLNVILGLFFLPKSSQETPNETKEAEQQRTGTLIPLKVKGKRQGIYTVPTDFSVGVKEAYHAYNNSDTAPEVIQKEDDWSSYEKLRPLGYKTESSAKLEQLRNVSLSKLVSEYNEIQSLSEDEESQLKKKSEEVSVTFSFDSLHAKEVADISDSTSESDTSDDSATSSKSRSSMNGESNESVDKGSGCMMYEMVRKTRGLSIANMLDCPETAKHSIKQIFKTKSALNFLLTSFITTGGYVAYNSIVGDFSKTSLKLTDEQYVLGLTILGISQLTTGVFYLIVTKFFTFSASFLYVVSITGASGVTFLLLAQPAFGHFCVLMAISGFFKSLYIASTFAAGMEVTSPTQAVFMFMIINFVEGVGGIVFPYLSSYLQVQVNLSAGLILAGSVQLLGAASLLPLSIQYLVRPKDYASSELLRNIEEVGFKPISMY